MLFSLLLVFSLLNSSLFTTIIPLFCLTPSSCNRQLSFNSTPSLPGDCLATLASSEFCSVTLTFNYLRRTVNIDYHSSALDDEIKIQTVLSETVNSTTVQYRCQTESLCEEAYLNRVYNKFVNMNYTLMFDALTSANSRPSEPQSNLTCIVTSTPLETKYESCIGQCQAQTFYNDSRNWTAECIKGNKSRFQLEILTHATLNATNHHTHFVYQCKQDVCNDLSRVDQIRAMLRHDYEGQLPTSVSAETTTITAVSTTAIPPPLLCLQSTCDIPVSLNTITLTLPDTCTAAISSESCSISVTFFHLSDTVDIQFSTSTNDDGLLIRTTLPHTDEYGTVMTYRCNSEFLCEWKYLNEVYHHYLRLNYSLILEVLTPENNFELPPLSEPDDLICIIDEKNSLCEKGKCLAETFFNDSQTWEGSCLPRSDFDLSIYQLHINTRNDDSFSSYYDSSFVYECYWNSCNTFEMVERIRTVIKGNYEVQLPRLGSTTTTTTTARAATTVTNSGVKNLTTTHINNGCANVDIGYYALLVLVLSSILF